MARKHIILPLHIWNIEGLTQNERLVLSVIYGYTEHGKPCFMTNTGLAKLLHITRRTASRAVTSLIDKGYIEALEGGQKRHLGAKSCLGGVDTNAQGGAKSCPTVIHKNNRDFNTETIMAEDRPKEWTDVRDFMQRLSDVDGRNVRQHIESWSKDFVTYYTSRQWQTKTGPIKDWRPVAQAWYKRSAEKVPQRAVKRIDVEALRRDREWHRRRRDHYREQQKYDKAAAEDAAINRITQTLHNHGQ